MNQSIATIAIMCACLCSAQRSSAQEISILLLDVRNGHALSQQAVTLTLHAQDGFDHTLALRTGTDGRTVVSLPQPVPQWIHYAGPSSERLLPCSTESINVQQVVTTGLVSRRSNSEPGRQCKFRKQELALPATPGLLVLFARPLTTWEKLLKRVYY